ncbi:MAG: hypothetical protein H6709_16075 [Kofleriaceae bacterium]|nr:hypothetical protein [Kofleriaceae bacterium]MCB9573597.1 hypothetical protein [Kofleriaceae bacterium]
MIPELDGLFDLMDWYFATFTEVKPSLAKILWGVYEAYDPINHTPAKIKVPKSKRVVPLKFFISLYTQAPVFVGSHYDDPADQDSDEVEGTFRVDRSWTFPYDEGEPRTVHIVTWDRLIDAVEDDEREMWRCGFPYAIPLSGLTRDFRESLYSKNLGQVHERPKGVDEDHSIQFLRALAKGATYNSRGEYYPKWRGGKVGKPPYESNTTDTFVAQAFQELELVRDQVYVVITGQQGLIVYQIVEDPDGGFRRVYAGGVPESQYLDTEAIKKAGKVPYEMWWLVTANGLDEPPKHRKRKTFSVPGDHATVEVVDPEAMVIDTIGKKAAAQLGHSGQFEWFVELVSLRFPDRFYVVDLRRHHNTWKIWGAVPLTAARDAVHPKIKQAMSDDPDDEYGGVFTAAARKQVEAALGDVNMLVLPQGLRTGDERFIGIDDVYAYLRSLDSGLISVMPVSDYVTALAAGQFGHELYESTKWIIPMAKAVTYAAAIAVGGWAAVEMGVSAASVRAWATNYARREISNRVLWGVVKRFGPALAMKLAELVLALWDDEDSKTDGAGRWRHFAHGFFEGYVVQTLYDNLYKKVVKIVTAGPKEYRMAVTINKVYHTMDRLQAVFSRLEDELDDAAVKQAVASFQGAVEHLIKGVALLISASYYVQHDDAAGMLDLLGRGGKGEQPPSAEEWEAEATHQVAEIGKKIAELVGRFESIDDVIGEIRHSKLVMGGAVLFVLRGQIFSVIKYTWKHHKGKSEKKPLKSKRRWAFYAIAIGAVLLLASDDGKKQSAAGEFVGEVLDKIFALLKEAVSGFPGRDEAQAELYGKIVGNLLGGFVLDRFLFKDDHAFRKVFDAPIVDATLKRNLKHGVVKGFLSLIFKRYLSLYNDLVKNGVLSKARREQEFASLVDTFRKEELEKRHLEHLAKFESESEKSMSLQDLALALVGYHRVVQEDGVELLEQHYAGDMARLKDDLSHLAKLGDELGITGFAEEHAKALFVTMNTHVRLAVHELVEAIRHLFQPFVQDGHFSWMTLLKELGFDVGDISQIQNEVRQMYSDRLGDFGAKAD